MVYKDRVGCEKRENLLEYGLGTAELSVCLGFILNAVDLSESRVVPYLFVMHHMMRWATTSPGLALQWGCQHDDAIYLVVEVTLASWQRVMSYRRLF